MLGVLIRTKRHPAPVSSIDWSPDRRYVASASGQQVTIWAVSDGKKVGTLFLETTVSSLAWSPDGTRIAVGSVTDRAVTIWEAASGVRRLTYHGHTALMTRPDSTTCIWTITWLSDGRHVASKARELHVWDGETGATRWATTVLTSSFACSPDGRLIMTHEMEFVRVLDPERGDAAWYLEKGPERRVLRDAETGYEVQMLDPGPLPVAWMPDGRHVIQHYWRGISMYDTASQTIAHAWEIPYDPNHLALSPDGSVLATSGSDWFPGRDRVLCVSLWETRSGRLMSEQHWRKPWADAPPLAWSPDSKQIAVGAPGKSAQVWELRASVLPFGR